MDFFGVIPFFFGALWNSWTCMSVSFPRLVKFSVIILQINFLVLSVSSPAGIPIMWMLFHLMLSQMSLNLSSLLSLFFFLLCLSEFHCFLFEVDDSVWRVEDWYMAQLRHITALWHGVGHITPLILKSVKRKYGS